MKLWIISDLHLDFEMYEPVIPDADVCVVAGDILQGCGNSIRWLDRIIGPAMPVVFVAGNHEHYGHSIFEGLEWAKVHAAQCPAVRFLENAVAVIGGVRFIGCTLWTDYELYGNSEFAMAVASLQLNDHRQVAWRRLPVYEGFPPAKARELHQMSRAYLEAELTKPFDGETVVVTHHAPHPYSVNPRFKGSALNPAFGSDMGDLIVARRPALWVHGHMHDSVDYTVAGTRVIANPKGYYGENGVFDPALVVEV